MNLYNLLSTLIGVIVGGLITLGVNLYLQKRERKIQYAIKNRQEIYELLYNEIKQKHKDLERFRDPFNAMTTLETWTKCAPSTKLRVPNDLKKLIQKFEDAGRKFHNIYSKANPILIKHINDNLEVIRNELDKHKYSGDNFDILKRNVFEGYAGDFYSEIILVEEKHNYPPDKILKFRKGSSLTFNIFFSKVCSSLENEEQIVELRRMRGELIKITEELEKHLEMKIEFILKKYESRLVRV